MTRRVLLPFVATILLLSSTANLAHSETAKIDKQQVNSLRALFDSFRIEGGDTSGGIEALQMQLSLLETNLNRVRAARKMADEVRKSYENGRSSIDLLIDAKRRAHDAEAEFRKDIRNLDQKLLRAKLD